MSANQNQVSMPTNHHEFFPFLAIDLLDGQVVRLRQGNYDQKTVYYQDPIQLAKILVQNHICYLHIVDLNRARDPNCNTDHIPLIAEIRKILFKKSKLQLGGGIRTLKDIESMLALGIDRVILGTAAFTNVLPQAIQKFGAQKILVALDIKSGNTIQVQGWLSKVENVSLTQAVQILCDVGVEHVVFTDIDRDGLMSGPGELAQKTLSNTKINYIVSGGIANISDVQFIKEQTSAQGVIIGRAFYENKITLPMIASLTNSAV